MFKCLNFEVFHELAIYSHTTFKAHLLGLLGQHIFENLREFLSKFCTILPQIPERICRKNVHPSFEKNHLFANRGLVWALAADLPPLASCGRVQLAAQPTTSQLAAKAQDISHGESRIISLSYVFSPEYEKRIFVWKTF